MIPLKKAAGFSIGSQKTIPTFKKEPLTFDVKNVNFDLDGTAKLDPQKVTAPSKGDKSKGVVQAQTPAVIHDIGPVEDLLFISEALINLPCVIWDKLSPREPEKISAFNRAFHRYCVKKGIDPWTYFFDEFEMAMMLITILAGYRKDYIKHYPKNKKGIVDPLNNDYEHKKELDKIKEETLNE